MVPGGEDIGVEVDWEFAMKEANSETLKAMSSMNDQKTKEETSAREEMERKVALLEAELKRERDKSGEDQSEMMKQQKDLEIKLKSQIEATTKLLKKQERERQDRSLVDRQLLHTLPLVHEANGISQEMQKRIKFSVKLVSKALDALDHGGAAGEPVYKTSVCVVVNGIGGIGGDEMWSHEKFHNRIYIMREMYHTWKDNGMNLEGTEFEDKENDPFYDPPSDYLLGVARLQVREYALGQPTTHPLCRSRDPSAPINPPLSPFLLPPPPA